MRILHVIARLNAGGTARYLCNLSQGLTSKRVEHLIATGFVQSGEEEDATVASLPIVRVPHMGRAVDLHADWTARHELADVIREFKPDVIHTHTFKAGLLGRMIASEIPHVHTFHGFSLTDPEFHGFRGTVMLGIERVLARWRTDALIAISEQVAKQNLQVGIGKKLQPFTVIYPGVTPLQLPARKKSRTALGLDQVGIVVAWLARFAPVKAPERVIELARVFPEVTFVMAGDGVLLERVRTLAPPNVLLPGWTDSGLVYGAADIALLTSHSEGLGIALLEAQLAGLPVVATDVGGISEVVEHGVTGLLCEPQDLESALRSLIEDPQLRSRMGEAGSLRSQARFSVEQMTRLHIELYERLLKRFSEGSALQT